MPSRHRSCARLSLLLAIFAARARAIDEGYLAAHVQAAPLEPLREWLLHRAGINDRFINKTLATLLDAEVVEVPHLRVLRRKTGLDGLFRPATAGLIEDALDMEPRPLR